MAEESKQQNTELSERAKLLESGKEEDLHTYVKEIKRQINSAQEIQENILPDKLPPWNCLKFAARYIAMDDIGGDYYDTFHIKGDRLGLIMADVSGHGIPAALVTTMAKVAFATHGQRNTSTKELLYNVNKDLVSLMSSTGFYMTCFALNIDKDLRVRYTNAGHEKAILYRDEDDSFHYLDTNGLFLGIFEDAGEVYEENEIQLYPGDRIILYTDGIVETMNKDREEYGQERFEEMIRFSSALESEQVVDLVVDDIKKHAEGSKFRDDVSILVLEVELRYKKYLDKIKEAEEEEEKGNIEKWRKALEEAVRINPDSLKSRKKLAVHYLKQKEYEKAIKHLKTYIEKNKESPYIYTLFGFCQYKMGKLNKAISITKTALHILPKYQEAIQNLAFYYIKSGNNEEAKKYIDKLKEINPDNNMIESLTKLLNNF
ncbi:MAG: SpoIIE family protein phosphatase [Spirochaetota bacterium]